MVIEEGIDTVRRNRKGRGGKRRGGKRREEEGRGQYVYIL